MKSRVVEVKYINRNTEYYPQYKKTLKDIKYDKLEIFSNFSALSFLLINISRSYCSSFNSNEG